MMGGDWNCEGAEERQRAFRAAIATRWPQFKDLNRLFFDFEKMNFAAAEVREPDQYSFYADGTFSDGGFGAIGYFIDLLEKGKYFGGIYQGSGPTDANVHTFNRAMSVADPEFIVGYMMHAVPDIYKSRENTLPAGVEEFIKSQKAVVEEYRELLPQTAKDIIDPVLVQKS